MFMGHGDVISQCLKGFVRWFLFSIFLIPALKIIAKILENQKTEGKNKGIESKNNGPRSETKGKFAPETTSYDHHCSLPGSRLPFEFLHSSWRIIPGIVSG